MGRRIERERPDVVHGPHYTLPKGLRAPGVVTFHDPTFFTMPEVHERAKVAYFGRMAREGIRRAERVIAVSSFARDGADRPRGRRPLEGRRRAARRGPRPLPPRPRRGRANEGRRPPTGGRRRGPLRAVGGRDRARARTCRRSWRRSRRCATPPTSGWCSADRGRGVPTPSTMRSGASGVADRVLVPGFVSDADEGGAAARGVRLRVPVARGGLRDADPRGDGVRNTGRDDDRVGAGGGRGRRGPARRATRRGRASRPRSLGSWTIPTNATVSSNAASAGRATSRGRRRPTGRSPPTGPPRAWGSRRERGRAHARHGIARGRPRGDAQPTVAASRARGRAAPATPSLGTNTSLQGPVLHRGGRSRSPRTRARSSSRPAIASTCPRELPTRRSPALAGCECVEAWR